MPRPICLALCAPIRWWTATTTSTNRPPPPPPGPSDPPLTAEQTLLHTAAELLCLLEGLRGVVLVQLHVGWDADTPAYGMYRPLVLTLLRQAAARKDVAVVASALPAAAGGAQKGLTAVLSADKDPFRQHARLLAGFGCQVRAMPCAKLACTCRGGEAHSPASTRTRACVRLPARLARSRGPLVKHPFIPCPLSPPPRPPSPPPLSPSLPRQAALEGASPYYKLLVGRVLGYKDEHVMHHVMVSCCQGRGGGGGRVVADARGEAGGGGEGSDKPVRDVLVGGCIAGRGAWQGTSCNVCRVGLHAA